MGRDQVRGQLTKAETAMREHLAKAETKFAVQASNVEAAVHAQLAGLDSAISMQGKKHTTLEHRIAELEGTQGKKYVTMEDQLASLAENHLTLDEFREFCDGIKLAMHNKTQEVAKNTQAQLKDVEAWMREQGTRADNLESGLRKMESNITRTVSGVKETAESMQADLNKLRNYIKTETSLAKTVADMRENSDGIQAQVTRLQNTLKQQGVRVNDVDVILADLQEKVGRLDFKERTAVTKERLADLNAQTPPEVSRRAIELEHEDLGAHRLGLASLGHVAAQAHPDPEAGAIQQARKAQNESIQNMENTLRSIRQKLEDVQDNHLTIDEFGEFATGMAGAHERVWKRFEDMILDIQQTLANNARTTRGKDDAALIANMQQAEAMITDFFEQVSAVRMAMSPGLDAQSERAFQSMQAQVAQIERSNEIHASSITGIQSQLTRISELVMARRSSANSIDRNISIGTHVPHERLVELETAMKGLLSAEEFREFKYSIENAISAVAESARTMQTRLDVFDSPFKQSFQIRSKVSIEAAMKEVALVMADVQTRVSKIDGTTPKVVADRRDAVMDSKVDVSRVLRIENVVEDLSGRLEQKADLARVERGEVSLNGVQTKLSSVEEVVGELADAMTAYLELPRQS